MLTIKTLVSVMARRCGLQDPDAFDAAGGVWAGHPTLAPSGPRPPDRMGRARGSGRTTRTILEALVALNCGAAVEIVTHYPEHVDYIANEIVRLAEAARFDSACLCHLVIRSSEAPPMEFADLRLADHTVAEMEPKHGDAAGSSDLDRQLQHSGEPTTAP